MSNPAEHLAYNLLPIARTTGNDVRWTMEERIAHYRCPGLSVAVMEGDEVAWSAGYGHIEEGKPEQVNAQTMFSGASMSKPVTCLLALQQVERGALDLDADVNRYLKSWQVPENEFTRQQPVTLRLLLSHRAGTTLHGFGAYSPDGELPRAIDILTRELTFKNGQVTRGVTVNKVPGGSTRYSGGGTTVVEQLLEDVTDKRFYQLAQDEVFGPLGLKHTTFEAPLPARFRDNAAVGHEEGATLPEKFVYVPAIGAGAIFTTAADYARIMLACRAAYLGKPKAILGQSIARQMMARQGHGEFGLGWELFGDGPNRRFGHGGSNAGYQCESTCQLDSGQGAVVMTNADSGLVFYWEVFNGIADMQGWKDFMLPVKTVRPIPEADFPRYVGVYDVVSGVEAPTLSVWVEDGRLKSQVAGMRGGARDMLMDQNGRFFSQTGPYETEVTYDNAGNAVEMAVLRDGKTEIMRARRRKTD